MEVLKFPEMRLKKDAVVYQIPIEKIRSNPYQPRRYFQRAALEELSASIREYGILQPLTVRKMSGGSYELVAGERRLRAAELAGLETVPCLLVQVNEYDSAMLALLENIQRQNLSFLEEAEGYRNLMEDYGLTQEELASKLSKSQSFIANKLRILKLEDPLKRLLVENNFTERHARALLKLPDEETRTVVLIPWRKCVPKPWRRNRNRKKSAVSQISACLPIPSNSLWRSSAGQGWMWSMRMRNRKMGARSPFGFGRKSDREKR